MKYDQACVLFNKFWAQNYFLIILWKLLCLLKKKIKDLVLISFWGIMLAFVLKKISKRFLYFFHNNIPFSIRF